MDDVKSGPASATVWTIAEPGARTWREARDMVFNGTERLTVHTYADSDHVSVFVGCKLRYDNALPKGVVPGTPDFYDWARTVAISHESGMPFMECMPGQRYAHLRGPLDEEGSTEATYAEIIDHALTVAFPVGFYFSVRDQTGTSYGSFRTVREARAYIGEWDADTRDRLSIRPYHGNGRQVMRREVRNGTDACLSTHDYMGHRAACVLNQDHDGQHADICGVHWGWNR